MKTIERLRKTITGALTGSCIVLFNPMTPIDTRQQCYTLEELSYQETRQVALSTAEQDWSYQWVVEKGFVLRPDRKNLPVQQSAGLRRAVYRTVVK